MELKFFMDGPLDTMKKNREESDIVTSKKTAHLAWKNRAVNGISTRDGKKYTGRRLELEWVKKTENTGCEKERNILFAKD